jgi:hypothetical protein
MGARHRCGSRAIGGFDPRQPVPAGESYYPSGRPSTPVASCQYLREAYDVASFEFLRQPWSFQAWLTGGLERGAALA